MKRKSLLQIRFGRPPFSYRPLRSCLDDIFNVQPDLSFGTAAPTCLGRIEHLIERRSVHLDEAEHNKRVARGLFDFASSENVFGRKHEFFPLAMSVGRKVCYWQPMVISIDNDPYAVFIEPRRSKGLTADGRRFAFSMMHERIRASDDDFAEIGLAIIRFNDPEDDRRAARLYIDKGVTLYALDELERMVSETYAIWREICEDREREARHRPTGTGPLFD